MSDEYSVDAKYKRDNLVDEHRRYEQALDVIHEYLLEAWAAWGSDHMDEMSLATALWLAGQESERALALAGQVPGSGFSFIGEDEADRKLGRADAR